MERYGVMAFNSTIVNFFGAGLFVEAAVVGAVCLVFLLLMVVAGIKEILKGEDR
jgi:hypothetical protein